MERNEALAAASPRVSRYRYALGDAGDDREFVTWRTSFGEEIILEWDGISYREWESEPEGVDWHAVTTDQEQPGWPMHLLDLTHGWSLHVDADGEPYLASPSGEMSRVEREAPAFPEWTEIVGTWVWRGPWRRKDIPPIAVGAATVVYYRWRGIGRGIPLYRG